MKKVKATAGTDETPDVTAAPAPPEPIVESTPVRPQVIAPRLTGEECAAIEAAYRAGNEALSSVVHKLYLFGYRA